MGWAQWLRVAGGLRAQVAVGHPPAVYLLPRPPGSFQLPMLFRSPAPPPVFQLLPASLN